MKILILSCNTGEGHNSAGWAVKEYLELQGHQVVMEDMMLLKGARTSKAVGGAYVGIVKHFPLLFGLGYRLGGWVSSVTGILCLQSSGGDIKGLSGTEPV